MSNRDSIGDEQLKDSSNESVSKEYRLSNGKVLQFTKEEFGEVVDAFRMLLAQDQINVQKKK